MHGESAQILEAPPGAAAPATRRLSTPQGVAYLLAVGHSDEAAARAVSALAARLAQPAGQPSASALAEALREIDAQLGPNASVTAAVLWVSPRRVLGAIAGRARVLRVGAGAGEVLGQGVAPGLGSGRVAPVAFSQPLDGQTVVLGTDSVFERASAETLYEAVRGAGPGRAAARLAEFSRDQDGCLAGPIAVVVHRPTAAPEPLEAPSDKPRVLFAEAHEGFVRSVSRSVLRDFEVIARGRVADALDASSESRFDVALVDYDLGDETGDVLVRALRERGFVAPIIAVSAKDSANKALVAAGADTACSKLAFGQIAAVIRGLLEG